MDLTVINGAKRGFLIITLLLQLMVCLTIFFDIPIARQLLYFFYFTFFPGFIFLKLLNLDKFSFAEKILFSVGFSVAFLMLFGLLVNAFGSLFGFFQPLSLLPLMMILNSTVFIGVFSAYLKNEDFKIWKNGFIEKSIFMFPFLCLPILSIIGATFVNVYGNNLVLLFTFVAISVLFIGGVVSEKILPSNFYPFAVFMIAIALLYHSSLITNYIIPFGSDVPSEYFLFKMTERNALWSTVLPSSFGVGLGRYNSMLSITVLPTVYSVLSKIDSIWMFKLLFPLIFSFVPLGLYQVWQTYVSKKHAFFAAFLFMALFTFYTEMLGLIRQMIGELFFVLLLLVIVNRDIKHTSKMICFMFFSFALVASHYALAAIFLFFISFALVALFTLKRPRKNINVTMVIFFFTVMFTWYIYTSGSATFNSILEVGDYVYRQLGDFFNPAARGETVLRGLGLESPPTIWNAIGRFFAYLTEALIAFGFVGLITKRVKARIENEFFVFSLLGMAFLAMLVLVPGLAKSLNMTRFYHILLFFLSPLCALGGEFIVKLFSRNEREYIVSILLLTVLVPYFLFQTNFVYEVVGSDSWSIPLSKYRMNTLRLYGHYGYPDHFSVFGAKWASRNINISISPLYADVRSAANVLTIYGMIYAGYVNSLSNTTTIMENGTVYLSRLNVIENIIPFGQFSWNTSDLSHLFDDLDLVYNNGGSEIYTHLP
ncbi:MAG: DUF2206 domain-containing protein [Candidatus Bathyarchaeia archaeon]